MTLSKIYNYWKANFAVARYAKTTMACYNQIFVRIKAVMGHLRIDKIKPIQMIEFFAQLSSHDAKNNDTHSLTEVSLNIANYYSCFFSSALKWELI